MKTQCFLTKNINSIFYCKFENAILIFNSKSSLLFEDIHISKEESINAEDLQKIIDSYIFSEKQIERDDVIEALKVQPKLLQRRPIAVRIIDKIMNFVNTFIRGVAA